MILIFALSALKGQTYEGTIILKNGKKIEADVINVEENVLRFKNDYYSDSKIIDKSEVRMLRVSDGNYAAEGLGLGAVLGFAIYLNAMRNFDSFNFTILSYSMAGGALIGLAIGALTTNKKSIRITDNSSVSVLDSQYFNSFTNEVNLTLIKYQLKF